MIVINGANIYQRLDEIFRKTVWTCRSGFEKLRTGIWEMVHKLGAPGEPLIHLV